MRNRWVHLQETMDKACALLDQLERRTEKMETILMVREPSSSAAAEAYEGLRKQIVTAVTERLAHLSQLVQLDAALAAGADVEYLARLVNGWVEQTTLAKIADPDHPSQGMLFEMVEDRGGAMEILEPAYVDTSSGRVMRQGRARRAGTPAGAVVADQEATAQAGEAPVPRPPWAPPAGRADGEQSARHSAASGSQADDQDVGRVPRRDRGRPDATRETAQ